MRKKQLKETWRKEWEDKMISEEEERTRRGRNSLRRRGERSAMIKMISEDERTTMIEWQGRMNGER